MEIILWSILSLFFLYINYRVIKNDLKEKRIPNSDLLLLIYMLPIWYLYAWYFGYFHDLSLYRFIIETVLTLVIGFMIFHFGKWWAGDAKYLLVLSLFIPHIWVIPLIFSIAITTIIYLIFYFIWFWIGPNLWVKQRRDNIYRHIIVSHKDIFISKYRWKSKKDIYLLLLKYLNLFLVFFMLIRFTKIHLFTYLENNYSSLIINLLFHDFILYILIICACCFYWIIYLGKVIHIHYLANVMTPYFSTIIVNIVGMIFLIYEYLYHSESFIINLSLIFTLYLWIYIWIKTLIYLYIFVFKTNEEILIPIYEIKPWYTIDKKWIQRVFMRDNDIINISPISNYNSLNQEEIVLIQNNIKKINQYNSNDIITHIPCLKTFNFSSYIFGGFMLQFLFLYIFQLVKEVYQNLS